MAKKKLDNVTAPGRIGKLELRNRMVRMGAQPMPNVGNESGEIPDELLDYYEALAAGGMALVTIAGGFVELHEPEQFVSVRNDSDDLIPSLTRAAAAIHKHGAAAFWQLMCPYPAIKVGDPNKFSICSSAKTQEELDGLMPYYVPPREATVEEIEQLVAKFAEICVRLQKAGFDGVEINSAHIHFLNTFLSPAWNKRTDEYGGDAAGRSKIVCDIVRAVKEACGPDFAVVNLINGFEYGIEGGITVEDAIEHAKCIEAAGSDGFRIRAEFYHQPCPGVHPFTAHECPDIDMYPELLGKDLKAYGIDNSFGNGVAAYSEAAARIKQAVSVPIICDGRMDAFVGDKLISEGKIDYINLMRRTFADHDYANKIMAGDFDEIRPCVGCFTCYDMSERGLKSWCMVNPSVLDGREYGDIAPAETKKKVLVVGAGASGLEAARVLALRGHDVTIADREPHLGGSLPLAAFIKDFHEDFQRFSDWQVRQVQKLGVKCDLKTEVDRGYIERMAPDAVVLAVGAKESEIDIPGIDSKIVMTGAKLHEQLRKFTKVVSAKTLGKLSKVYMPFLGKKVLVLGGAIYGVQTAKFLLDRGREVIVVEESNEIGKGMLDCGPKPNLVAYLMRHGVEFRYGVSFQGITDKGLTVVNSDGIEELIGADTIVTALPMLPNHDLYERVKDAAPEVYMVGDCDPAEVDAPYPPLMLQPMDSEPMWPHFTAPAVRAAYQIARSI